jgi:hypothetical protein
MQFNNPTSTKNENKKYDNSTRKKINRPVAFAARYENRAHVTNAYPLERKPPREKAASI